MGTELDDAATIDFHERFIFLAICHLPLISKIMSFCLITEAKLHIFNCKSTCSNHVLAYVLII